MSVTIEPPNPFNIDFYKPLPRLPNENKLKHFALEFFSFLSKLQTTILISEALLITTITACGASYSLVLLAITVSSFALSLLFPEKDNSNVVLKTIGYIGLTGLSCYVIETMVMTFVWLSLMKKFRSTICEFQSTYTMKAKEEVASIVETKRKINKLILESDKLIDPETLSKIQPKEIEFKGSRFDLNNLSLLNLALKKTNKTEDFVYYTYTQQSKLTKTTLKLIDGQLNLTFRSVTDDLPLMEIEQISALVESFDHPPEINSITFESNICDLKLLKKLIERIWLLEPKEIKIKDTFKREFLQVFKSALHCYTFKDSTFTLTPLKI